MTWGMEDPTGRAREGMALDTDDGWETTGGRPRRRRPRDGIWVLLFIVLAAGAIVVALQREDQAAADSPRAAIARGEVTGLAEGSMARPSNLRAFLEAARDQAAGDDRVKSIRIAPARVNLTMVRPSGGQYFIDGSTKGRVSIREFADTNQAVTARIDDIDPAAVRAAIISVARRGGMAPTKLDYLVVSDPGPRQSIVVYFDADNARDKGWVGQGDGTQMRRLSPNAPGGTPPPEPSAPAAPAAAQPPDPLELALCVDRAGDDIAAIQRCLR